MLQYRVGDSSLSRRVKDKDSLGLLYWLKSRSDQSWAQTAISYEASLVRMTMSFFGMRSKVTIIQCCCDGNMSIPLILMHTMYSQGNALL